MTGKGDCQINRGVIEKGEVLSSAREKMMQRGRGCSCRQLERRRWGRDGLPFRDVSEGKGCRSSIASGRLSKGTITSG